MAIVKITKVDSLKDLIEIQVIDTGMGISEEDQ
jgi:signal transduction histidine kinase